MRKRPETHHEAVARLVAQAVEQGLGPTITDEAALDRAATLFVNEPKN
jgi:hypothetical protein